MPYQYNGAEPDNEFHGTTPTPPRPQPKGNNRLQAAVLEAARHGRTDVVAMSRTGHTMSADTARRLQAMAKAMPMGLTREQLLAIGGYRSVDAFKTQCALHGLTKLRAAFMARPYTPLPRRRILRTKPAGKAEQQTTDRFNMVDALLTYAPNLTREELMRRAGWRLDYFAKATRRHQRRDLWDRAAALPREPITGHRGRPPGPTGPTGPRASTKQRFENLEYVLEDSRTTQEEALQRAGWTFKAFERACYRNDRLDVLDAYHRHGQALGRRAA